MLHKIWETPPFSSLHHLSVESTIPGGDKRTHPTSGVHVVYVVYAVVY